MDLKGEEIITKSESYLEKIQNSKPLPFTQEFFLIDVSYYYPGIHELAIKGLNLAIKPNTSIGLVGSTG